MVITLFLILKTGTQNWTPYFLDQLSWLATNYLFAPTLYKLNPDPFSEFTKFLKTPKLDHYCRVNVYEYVGFYVEKNPALKEQATAWVKDMLVFYDD